MPRSARFVMAVKGAVLWVLLASVLGIAARLVAPVEATLGLPWVAASVGVAGAVAHAVVALVKPDPGRFVSTAALITVLGSGLALSVAYWMVGTPPVSAPLAAVDELRRALMFVIAPMAAVGCLVLLLLRHERAA